MDMSMNSTGNCTRCAEAVLKRFCYQQDVIQKGFLSQGTLCTNIEKSMSRN